MSDKRDCIVIGAGFAGLTAARKLQQANKDVVVVEARDRIGGRVHSQELEVGATIDLGAQWIGPTQQRMYDLVEEFAVEIFPTYESGDNILHLNNRTSQYRGTIPRTDIFSLLNLGWAMAKMDRMAKKICLDAPWQTINARELDSQTLATWMDRHFYSKTARELFTTGLGMIFACNPADISLLHTLFYIHSGTNLDTLLATRGGAQQDRFTKGAQFLASQLAESLDIKLESPVRRIIQSKDSVEVVSDHHTFTAKRVIVAIPPTLAGRIDYQPALPALRDQLTQRMPMGSVIKCFAVYEQPFWRERGLSGHVVTDTGPVKVTFDCSPDDAKVGILLGFVESENAREFSQLVATERQRLVLGNLARYFGEKARNILHYQEKNWMDELWSRGCYAGYMPPGIWTSYGKALRQPVGRIHWAGTETAQRWNGYMEGAVESGERVALEVLNDL